MQKYKLSEVCKINPKDTLEDLSSRVSFVPMQSVSEAGNIDVSETRCASEVIKGFTSFKDGDVLMAKITPCMENGKGAVATGLCNGRGFGSTEFFVIRPDYSKVRSEWIYYYTVQKQFRLDCERNMTGSAGQKRVPKTYLENREIPIPTLAEQDHALRNLSRIKKIISLRQQQLQKLDELVKARFVELFGDPVLNPHGFEKVVLSDLADIKIGPFGSLLHKEDYIEGGHALVNPSHIIDGKIAIDNKFTISETKYAELNAYHLQTGDVVLGRRGEMGRCAVVSASGLLCGTGSLLIRPKGKVTADYIQKIISFPSFKKTIEDMAVGQTMPNLNAKIVSNFQIIKPPIEIQKAYYKFVEQTDKSKAAIQKALDEAQLLFDSLMQKYFG